MTRRRDVVPVTVWHKATPGPRGRAQSTTNTPSTMSLDLIGTYAPNPTSVRARTTQLDASPQGDKLVYAQGRTVVIRRLDDPHGTTLYAQHAQPVTVARISPSGYYVASADASGKVRVWDIAGDEQTLKLEVAALGGRVHDLTWDGESKRILVVGEGREKYAHAFLADTGSSVGELSGHSKPVNAVCARAQRPFRAVTGADDANVIFYTGVPFKYARTLSYHTRFVHDVAYAPNGSAFASAGADGRIFTYEGQGGDMQGELKRGEESAHSGTVFAIQYAPDSSLLASAGADGCVRVWDVATRTVMCEWHSDEPDRVHAQQVGLVWTRKNEIISLSLSGVLTVLEPDTPMQVRAMLCGPTMGNVGVALRSGMIGAACRDGRVYTYNGGVERVPMHSAWPTPVAFGSADAWVVASLDNNVRQFSTGDVAVHSVQGHIRHMHVNADATYVLTDQGLSVGDALYDVPDDATCVAAQGSLVAIGTHSAQVHLYRREGAALNKLGDLTSARSAITALAFSPDAALLAAGESNGKILVYDTASQSLKLHQWVFHTARIHSIAWSADGAHAVSTSLDTHIYVWSVARPMHKAVYKNAHAGGACAAVWRDAHTIVSSGADGAVRTFRFAA